MRFATLSGGHGWHVGDLTRAARASGHSVDLHDFRKLYSVIHDGRPTPLEEYDGVIVRTMPPGSLEQVVFRMNLLHRLEKKGILVLNPARSLELCVDKFLTTALLGEAGLPVPPTMVCQHADAAMDAFHQLGGDVVVKPLFGSEGRGMVRITDLEIAWRTFHTLERIQSVIYLQQFIHHPGWDLRIFILGQKMLAAMRRIATGDWRTNVAQGGTGEKVMPSPQAVDLAIQSVATLGVLVAGVDLMVDPEGKWYVIEVNAVPGWRALAPVCGVDVASAVVDFMVQKQSRG